MTVFNELVDLILSIDEETFDEAALSLVDWVDSSPDFNILISEIGTIPESIIHDSTQEKLFSKVSDAVLARGFRELGLDASVSKQRGDCADVIAKSRYHGYTLVADAKAFRLSRTARNQKDYKVSSLSGWRNDSDYAVLCAPYFKYPIRNSQIYKQSIENNVSLFSWELLLFFVNHKVTEAIDLDLSFIWNWSGQLESRIIASDMKRCYFAEQYKDIVGHFGFTDEQLVDLLKECADTGRKRGMKEIEYWTSSLQAIYLYTREEAIEELIASKKIPNKIHTIEKFIEGLPYGE